MWLFLVAAGSAFLIRCYHKALNPNDILSDFKERVTSDGTVSGSSSLLSTDTIQSLPASKCDAIDESLKAEICEAFQGENDYEEASNLQKRVLRTCREDKGNHGKYLDWGFVEKRSGSPERKFATHIDRRNRDRHLVKPSVKEVPHDNTYSTSEEEGKSFAAESEVELCTVEVASPEASSCVASASHTVARVATNQIEAGDEFITKSLSASNDVHHAEKITIIESQESVQERCPQTASQDEAKASLVLPLLGDVVAAANLDKKLSGNYRELFYENEAERQHVGAEGYLPCSVVHPPAKGSDSGETGLHKGKILAEQVPSVSYFGNNEVNFLEKVLLKKSSISALSNVKRRRKIEIHGKGQVNHSFLHTQGLSLHLKRNFNKRKPWRKVELSTVRRIDEGEKISEGSASSLLGALLFGFGVGVGLLHRSCKLNGSRQSHQQMGYWVQEMRSELGGTSLNSAIATLQTANKQSFNPENDSFYGFIKGLQPLRSFREPKSEKVEEHLKSSCAFSFEVKQQKADVADLETELQAELDLLLTSFTDKDSSKQQTGLLDISDLGLDWAVASVDGEAINELLMTCTEEAKNQSAQIANQNQAVSPRELDRRLRVLLESRQEERISELEAEVHALLEELEMKDQELQLWKDRFRRMLIASQNACLGNRIGSVQNGDQEHSSAIKDLDPREAFLMQNAGIDVRGSRANNGESIHTSDTILNIDLTGSLSNSIEPVCSDTFYDFSQEFPLVWEESSDSDNSPSKELIMQIVERNRSHFKTLKGAQFALSELERDVEGSSHDTETASMVHLSNIAGSKENKEKTISANEGWKVGPLSMQQMPDSSWENTARVKIRAGDVDFLEEYFESQDFMTFKNSLQD